MRGGAAGFAGVFLIAVIVLLVATVRTSPTQLSVRIGVLAGVAVLLFGCAVGFVMIFNNSGVYQGTIGVRFTERTTGYLGPDAATVGREYLLIRPATDGGDLVLLAVPALLLAHTAMRTGRQVWLMLLAVGSVAVATVLLLVHALRQLPLNQLGPIALAVLATCALCLMAVHATVAWSLVKQRRTTTRARV